MERIDRRLAEAAAALATLDELAGKAKRTLVERDSAVLRLIYSFEAVWKACQKMLAALENVSAASPNATIRAARALGWLSDEDAEAAIKLGEERNLAVHMYRDQVGQQIEAHLAAMPLCFAVGSRLCGSGQGRRLSSYPKAGGQTDAHIDPSTPPGLCR